MSAMFFVAMYGIHLVLASVSQPMRHTESGTVTGLAFFGPAGATFESLLGFVAQLSMVLWSVVILTAIIRFVGIRIYRRSASATAILENVTPGAAAAMAQAKINNVRPGAAQLSEAGPVRPGLPLGSVGAGKYVALVPALATNSREA